MLKLIGHIDNRLLYLLSWCTLLAIIADVHLYGLPTASHSVVLWFSGMFGQGVGGLIISLFGVYLYNLTKNYIYDLTEGYPKGLTKEDKVSYKTCAAVATMWTYFVYFGQTIPH